MSDRQQSGSKRKAEGIVSNDEEKASKKRKLNENDDDNVPEEEEERLNCGMKDEKYKKKKKQKSRPETASCYHEECKGKKYIKKDMYKCKACGVLNCGKHAVHCKLGNWNQYGDFDHIDDERHDQEFPCFCYPCVRENSLCKYRRENIKALMGMPSGEQCDLAHACICNDCLTHEPCIKCGDMLCCHCEYDAECGKCGRHGNFCDDCFDFGEFRCRDACKK